MNMPLDISDSFQIKSSYLTFWEVLGRVDPTDPSTWSVTDQNHSIFLGRSKGFHKQYRDVGFYTIDKTGDLENLWSTNGVPGIQTGFVTTTPPDFFQNLSDDSPDA